MTDKTKPFFSIGVVTYKRPELLKECLQSIAVQAYPHFEVLIGNDDPSSPLSLAELGINDHRFKLFNHAENLGEMANLNYVLDKARGDYFTWLGDDDMFTDSILEQIFQIIEKRKQPPVLYYDFQFSRTMEQSNPIIQDKDIEFYDSKSFLRSYLERKLPLQGTYGIYQTKLIQKVGGIKKLGNGFSPGSDILIALELGSRTDIIYIRQPLVLFRSHEDSLSFSSKDTLAYQTAFHDLFLRFSRLQKNEPYLIHLLLKWCSMDFFDVVRRSQSLPLEQVFSFMRSYFALFSYLTINLKITAIKTLLVNLLYQLKVTIKSYIKSLIYEKS